MRSFIAIAGMLLCIFPAQAQDRVGAAVAVNPNADAIVGPNTRRLFLGDDILYRQRIVTQDNGQALIDFLDKSSIAVGADSDMVIDEFVYNPSAGTGKMVASVAKGVFRFVGGSLSKNPDSVTIKTPVSTIGVRGGIVMLEVVEGTTTVVMPYGREMTVAAANGRQNIRRNEYGVVIRADGQISEPGRLPPETYQRLMMRLEPVTPNPVAIDANRVAGIAGRSLPSRDLDVPLPVDPRELTRGLRALPVPPPPPVVPPPVAVAEPPPPMVAEPPKHYEKPKYEKPKPHFDKPKFEMPKYEKPKWASGR
jgi:hypothetical protein